jgi:hypothetical protein
MRVITVTGLVLLAVLVAATTLLVIVRVERANDAARRPGFTPIVLTPTKPAG